MQTVTAEGQSTTYIFGHDGHANVRVLYDLAASIAQVFSYAAYGEMVAVHNSVAALVPGGQAGALTSLGYAGEHFDAKAAQQYLRARFYDPNVGRFSSLDTYSGDVDAPVSFHKYTYGSADPISFSDASGKFSVAVSIGIAGLIGGLVGGFFAWRNGGTYDGTLHQIAWGALEGGLYGAAGAALFFGIGAAFAGTAVVTAWSTLAYWMATLGSGFLVGFAQGAIDAYRKDLPLYEIFYAGLENGLIGAAFGAGIGILFQSAPPVFRWLAARCFVEDTPVMLPVRTSVAMATARATIPALESTQNKPIQLLRLGERVESYNPEALNYHPVIPNDDFRILTFEFRDSSSRRMVMELLRHKSWLDALIFPTIGSSQVWAIPEIDMYGIAVLQDISPCPEIASGKGSVITGRFTRRVDDALVTLRFDASPTSLTGTGTHRIWSEDFDQFKPIQDLTIGERVRSQSGTAVVTSIEREQYAGIVYNIEVDGEHAFFAGDASVLVHNAEYANLPGAAIAGRVAELGKRLAADAKSLYAIAGEHWNTSRFTPLIVELRDGTRKLLVNGNVTRYTLDRLRFFARNNGFGVDAENIIVGNADEHAEDVLRRLYRPSDVKAVGIGQSPCETGNNCRANLINDDWKNVYWVDDIGWEVARVPDTIPPRNGG